MTRIETSRIVCSADVVTRSGFVVPGESADYLFLDGGECLRASYPDPEAALALVETKFRGSDNGLGARISLVRSGDNKTISTNLLGMRSPQKSSAVASRRPRIPRILRVAGAGGLAAACVWLLAEGFSEAFPGMAGNLFARASAAYAAAAGFAAGAL